MQHSEEDITSLDLHFVLLDCGLLIFFSNILSVIPLILVVLTVCNISHSVVTGSHLPYEGVLVFVPVFSTAILNMCVVVEFMPCTCIIWQFCQCY